MDRSTVLEEIRTAVSAEEQRRSFEHLRDYVSEHPSGREATELLREVQERLAGTRTS